MDVLRHGAMPVIFEGVRAPSTLGSFLRSFSWGNVCQLGKVSRLFLAELASRAGLLPGAGQLAFVDIDSTQRRVYGHKKEGAAFGHAKIQGKTVLVRGLSALVATVTTPDAPAPVIAAARLRGGNASSARGAASLAVAAARKAGCAGTIIVRADSAYYPAAFTAACTRAGAFFSVTARMDPAIRAAIASIPEEGWTPVRYPRAVWDDQLNQWISDAQVAGAQYTAFTSKKKSQQVTARLIIRRVRDLNPTAEAAGQGELFPAWRHHAVFTDSPFTHLQAEEQHRDHAVIEQVFADLTSGPLAHAPSGVFAASAAWLTLAAIAHNLARTAGVLASPFHARARGATIRRDLIDVAARTARHGRGHLTMHLPARWHRQQDWMSLFAAGCGPPARAA